MVLLSLIFVVMTLVLVGVGVVLGLVTCALGVLLLGVGVLCVSILVGLRSGRPAAAWRALLLQAGVLAGMAAGAFLGWFVYALLSPTHGGGGGGVPWILVVGGVLGGASAGATVGLLVEGCLRGLQRRVSSAGVVGRVSLPRLPEKRS